MNTTHTKGPWKLEAGRNIVTPSGTFFLSYGKDKYGNPLFREFAELDRNAELIAEAGTVAHETGKTPRQLAEEHREMLEACRLALKMARGLMYEEPVEVDDAYIANKLEEAIAKAERED